MEVEITSGQFTARIKSQGAELVSVKSKEGLEYLWQAGEAWPRHAPVLFPIVGRLKENKYRWREKAFELNQHGFARDLAFELIAQTDAGCIFELRADNKTRDAYPFEFVLRIAYSMEENDLHCSYEILNHGTETMLFSVGAHPGFRCPLLPNEKFSDYQIELDETNVLQTNLRDGLREETQVRVSLENGALKLNERTFDRDALVFEGGQIQSARLFSHKNPHSVTCECAGWPYFGIWSKKGNQEFVCLEPWFGVADGVNTNQKLESKEGMIRLETKKTFVCSYTLVFT